MAIRTFECVFEVTAPLHDDMNEWPANIQDAVLAAADRKSAEVKLPLAIVHTQCRQDPDDNRYWVQVILSEVVVGVTNKTVLRIQ